MTRKYMARAGVLPLFMALFPALLSAQGVYVGANTHLVLNGSVNMVLNNAGFNCAGTLAGGNSTVVLSGNGGTNGYFTYFGGAGNSPTFYNMTINNPEMIAMLTGNIAVRGTITMQQGYLFLNGYQLSLDSTGSIAGESEGSRIADTGSGTIVIHAMMNAPGSFVNPGNIGLEITSAVPLGATTITRGFRPQSDSNNDKSIYCYYSVSPASNTNVNAGIRVHYFDGELAGMNEDKLALYSWLPASGFYVSTPQDSINTTNDQVFKSGIAQLTAYTLFAGVPVRMMAVPAAAGNAASPALTARAQTYPNPVHDHFTLTLYSPEDKDYIFLLSDQWGGVLQQQKVHCSAGSNTTITWNTRSYTAGIYYLSSDGPWKNMKIVKL